MKNDLLKVAEDKADEIADFVKTYEFGSMNFSLIKVDGTDLTYLTQPCFGELYGDKHTGIDFKYFISNPHFLAKNGYSQKDKSFISLFMSYQYWLANESIFSDCFVTKDPTVMLSRGTIFDMDYPASYVMSAAQAQRYILSNYGSLPVYFDLFKDSGINKDVLFFLCHRLMPIKNRFRVDTFLGHYQSIYGITVNPIYPELLKKVAARDLSNFKILYKMAKNTAIRPLIAWIASYPQSRLVIPALKDYNVLVERPVYSGGQLRHTIDKDDMAVFLNNLLKMNGVC